MRKRILVVVSVALASFLTGTMFSTNYFASGAKPPSVWDAIKELQAEVNSLNNAVVEQQAKISELSERIGIIKEYVDETSKVELLWISTPDDVNYNYYYGVTGHWNVTKLQNYNFKEELNATISGALTYPLLTGFGSPTYQPELKGYEQKATMQTNRQLSQEEMESVRLLIKEYLAHL
jgi:cell division protein FtsB